MSQLPELAVNKMPKLTMVRGIAGSVSILFLK
jgi:hypothetical protein